MGFRTSAFLFGTNPETGYFFLLPNLRVCRRWIRESLRHGLHGAYGHRLEARTRYPGTFFMAQLMWNLEASDETVVRKYCDWQTADAQAGIALAEAVLLLERFTYLGADGEIGARMAELTNRALRGMPQAFWEDLEYFPAMMEALAVIGGSVGVEDNTARKELERDFADALGKSSLFAPWQEQGAWLFAKYRGFLEKGWREGPF